MMRLRKAMTEDIGIIVAMWKEFLEEHDDIVAKRNPHLKNMNLRHEKADSMYEDFLRSNIESGDGVIFVAMEDDKIVGYSFGLIKDEIPIFKLKKYGYISDLYVKKEFRGNGISSSLKDEMISWFKSKDVEYASIGFYSDNGKAHEIYKNWGFFDYKIEARKQIV
jgi:GNAT superfamily N-acetyltransferase